MQRRPSDTENKLLMLYAIDKLGAITAQQLLLFMIDNDLMGYISIQLGLAELVDSLLLRKRRHPVGTLYALTGKGRDSLALFVERIPHSRRMMVDQQATLWRQRFRREKQMPAWFEKIDDGEYLVRLCLLEQDQDIMSLYLNVPTHKQAQQFCDAWIAQAGVIYEHIMRTLGESASASENKDGATASLS